MTHKSLLLIGAILLISLSNSTAQKLRVDTLYYNGSGELVDKSEGYLTYEIRPLDRKERLNGVIKKFNDSDILFEVIEYKKGAKSGIYERYRLGGKIMVYGNHDKGKRIGFWAEIGLEDEVTSIQEYNKNGELVATRDTPYQLSDNLNSNESLTDATFPGGMNAWNIHLSRNLRYPSEARRQQLEGSVYINFVVLSDGRIAIAKVTKSPHPSLSKEALRVLLLSPTWVPSKLNGKPVDLKMALRIVFRII